MSPGSVRAHLSRARQRLRPLVGIERQPDRPRQGKPRLEPVRKALIIEIEDYLQRSLASRGDEHETGGGLPEPNRVAQRLHDLFGQQLTALMAGVPDPTRVGKWARGEETPPAEVADRLLRASRIVEVLKERQSDEDVQAWFVGRNAQLGGRAPALVVATDPDRVEDAAHAFLAY